MLSCYQNDTRVDNDKIDDNVISYDAKSMSRKGNVKGKLCQVLYDTGSEITLMSYDFFLKLNLEDKSLSRAKVLLLVISRLR